jgi:hypothetical protein
VMIVMMLTIVMGTLTSISTFVNFTFIIREILQL